MANIFVTRQIPDIGIILLRNAGHYVEVNQGEKLNREELKKAVAGKDAILTLLDDQIDEEILSVAAPTCKVVSNYAVGYNNIDVAAASELEIMVTNTPGVLTDATADLAITLMLAAARRVVSADKFTREGKFKGWEPKLMLGQDITGKVLGIIGAGRIGAAVAEKMHRGFNTKILYYSRHQNEDLEKATAATQVELEELLQQSDIVSLHVPLTRDTKKMIGAKELSEMKPTAILVNTSRGEIVDEAALEEALRHKKIFAAGLDVYEDEPKINENLQKLESVVLLPHIGSATFETRNKMARIAAENILAVLSQKEPEFLVNKK